MSTTRVSDGEARLRDAYGQRAGLLWPQCAANTSANRALGDSTLETATRNYGALPEIVGKTRDVRRVREFVGADCSARTLVEFDDPL